ncbi:MAG: hypothetical protein KAQ92_01415, partial [Candidatus Aenigmarchaeota archaeon]|nr:hypothetical protein [Candidatus Aenigmarchaeota archaeon]
EYKKVYSSEPKKIENNCIEYEYKYADTNDFAGRVVLYEPSFEYFKKFGYPLKNFVGERGKAFLEEMTNIRYNNLNFAGETSLPMIQEFRDTKLKDNKFKEKIISTRLRINPITGGFRRLTFMSSVNIGGEQFYPNVKFPGDQKKHISFDYFKSSVILMEKFPNINLFPPVMYVELPGDQYNFYGNKITYDKNKSPAFLFFFTPEGRRTLNMSIEQTNQDKYIDSKYISHVSDKNKKEIDEIIANIVQAPYKFLAKCHSCGFYLSFWRGSNIHYGNFFLSESGKVFNVADITMHKENSYSIAIKRDLAVFYASNGGLYTLMRRLNFSKEDISMIEKVGKQTYLSEIKKIANNNTDNFVKKNANAILSSFSNEESLALTSDEKDKVNSDIKTNVNSIKEKTINDLEKH